MVLIAKACACSCTAQFSPQKKHKISLKRFKVLEFGSKMHTLILQWALIFCRFWSFVACIFFLFPQPLGLFFNGPWFHKVLYHVLSFFWGLTHDFVSLISVSFFVVPLQQEFFSPVSYLLAASIPVTKFGPSKYLKNEAKYKINPKVVWNWPPNPHIYLLTLDHYKIKDHPSF